MITVAEVQEGSAAYRAGIVPGDHIELVNGKQVNDVIDFQFLASGSRFTIGISRKDGSTKAVNVRRRPDESLGLGFPPFPIRRCRNKCIFCFVDQMPKGCRSSLLVKDDDYRASFLFGNYITLTNLNEDDWERIFAQRLSPLYVSVHASDADLRAYLLNNQDAPDIMTQMRRLAAGGIRMHAQIVLCPGINDGLHLERTVTDLASLHPAVQSIAAVPVGLTGHRTGLLRLRAYRPSGARSIIDQLIVMGRAFRRRLGTRLVFPSDELYIKAGYPFPPRDFYEDLPQLENGVGMVSLFLQEARRTRLPLRIPPSRITVATGVSFSGILSAAIARFRTLPSTQIAMITVQNTFLGPTVTVAGLLAGRDILRAIRGKDLGSRLLIPASAIKEDDGIFLDGLSLREIEEAAGVPVVPASSFQDIVEAVKAAGRGGTMA